jgi:excinuclease ABC subunit C
MCEDYFVKQIDFSDSNDIMRRVQSQIIKLKARALKLPDKPGVYFLFWQKKKTNKKGRAPNLRDRVRSYFSKDLGDTRGPLLVGMIQKSAGLKAIATGSLLEAVILEANLIKKYQPKYNTKEKDQKSFNYILITSEEFPRVLIVRGRNLAAEKPSGDIYGPFPKGDLLKEALRIIRKIFPFSDKCVPMAGKPCFNRQIGLCPGVCSGEMGAAEYSQQIRRIKMFLSGKMKSLIKDLENEMKKLAKEREFEKANEVKKKIFSLKHIQDIALIKKTEVSGTFTAEVSGAFRIEAIDVAHLAGASPVGVVVVIEDGQPKKSDYRKFILRKTPPGNDPAGLREVLERRLRHFEWPLPDLFVVDGGSSQLKTAERVLALRRLNIPLVAVVKDARHKPKAILGNCVLGAKYRAEVLLANSEAHRFAQKFHRERRDGSFRNFLIKVKSRHDRIAESRRVARRRLSSGAGV